MVMRFDPERKSPLRALVLTSIPIVLGLLIAFVSEKEHSPPSQQEEQSSTSAVSERVKDGKASQKIEIDETKWNNSNQKGQVVAIFPHR